MTELEMASGESVYTQLVSKFDNKGDSRQWWIWVKEELSKKEAMEIYLYADGNGPVAQRKIDQILRSQDLEMETYKLYIKHTSPITVPESITKSVPDFQGTFLF